MLTKLVRFTSSFIISSLFMGIIIIYSQLLLGDSLVVVFIGNFFGIITVLSFNEWLFSHIMTE